MLQIYVLTLDVATSNYIILLKNRKILFNNELKARKHIKNKGN